MRNFYSASLSFFILFMAVNGQGLAQTIASFNPSSACGGTTPTITITGTNFSGVTTVLFNGVSATSFTVVNATTITAVLPSSGVTSGFITIATPSLKTNSTNPFTVNPQPVVTIKSDYCAVPGSVHLTATCVPAAARLQWSTGDTTQSIDVDIASDYTVTAFLASGCSAKATVGVAKELVVNGDFTDGNTGFTSDYTYHADVDGNSELVDDSGTNGYSVGTDGQNFHYYFFGQDHTKNSTGNRNFLLVNGHGNTLTVWKSTVNILPNTTYYFSAWGMSLNDAAPFARLQFNVNGSQVGSIGSLNPGVANNTNNGWTRFYGTWTSGPTITSAVISVTDLETALSGNDFGLDDVSFGTLSTFIKLESDAGTDSQTVCANMPITNIQYSVGSTLSTPLVTGLPAGITATFNGVLETFSGTPTVSGTFNYIITTTGTCNPSSASGTITIPTATAGGTLSSLSVCAGSTDSLTLTGQTGTVQSWQFSINGGTTWTPIANTNASQPFSNLIVPTKYRAVINSGCGLVYSSVATLAAHNFWVGATSADWNTPSNWADSLLPDVSCAAVIIPQVTLPNVYPVLSSGTATINNLAINANASLTVTGAILQIAGSITNNGTFDVTAGTLNFNGTSAQTIPANAFATNKIMNLTINNNVSLGGIDSLTGMLSFSTISGKTFTTNGYLTLKSTASGSAAVGQVINGNNITGDVTVEHYVSAKRAWRFLSIPTQTKQTVKAAWQEGATSSASNPVQNYGTQVTNSINPTLQNGFDYYSADGPSVKKYDVTATGKYAPYTSINTAFDSIATRQGIMVFVRGDRTATGLGATPTPTILRTKGALYTGTLAPITVNANQFTSIGNPYASSLDMRTISKSAGVNNNFYIMDANLTGSGFGAFQTFTLIGSDYIPTPGGGSYPAQNSRLVIVASNYIQSGMAFFVDANNNKGGNLTLSEATKAVGVLKATIAQRGASSTVADGLLRTNLYAIEIDSSASLVDGVLNDYGDYDNAVDNLDALKVTNLAENLGIKSDNTLLVVERRQTVTPGDTIHLNMLKMKVKSYRFEIIGKNFNQPNLIATLEDSYTNAHTIIDVNAITTYDFNVINVPGSWNPSRFMIVFKQAAALPVTFSSVKAYRLNKDVAVEWKVENEINIKQYEVEKSADGQNFTKGATVSATGSYNTINYQWLDKAPATGNNYYRIKSIGINGDAQYSAIVKVNIDGLNQQMMVYPNPVVNGKINLHLVNQPKGNYGIRLTNKLGQVMMIKQIDREEGSSTETLQSNLLAHGTYQLEVTKPDNTNTNINIYIN